MSTEPELSDARVQLLTTTREAVLSTNWSRPAPQLSPVWFLWEDGSFVISSPAATRKVANIRRDPNVTLCISQVDSGRYCSVSGTAVVHDDDSIVAPTKRLISKYNPEADADEQWGRILSRGARALIVISPSRWTWTRI